MNTDDVYLTIKETAKILKVSVSTLYHWRSDKTFNLPSVRISKKILYRRSDIDVFLKHHCADENNAGENNNG
ncbi:MAG: helix-turn-helix domain-containing protein [Alphaproteobacteria bacterium]|nr:helix-turn-helix domain-containing protein [Alphaproteobacteria bacterium]